MQDPRGDSASTARYSGGVITAQVMLPASDVIQQKSIGQPRDLQGACLHSDLTDADIFFGD